MSGLVVGMTFRRLPTADHPLLLVALALAEQADSDGKSVFPSVDLVAAETRLSRRAVQYKIKELHDIGFLLLEKKGGGRKNPNVWAINVGWLESQPDRVKTMRAEKELKNQSFIKGAQDAPFQPVENLPLGAVDKLSEKVHKQCTNSAPTGAHNPPTHSPSFKPPLDELVDAALWLADRSTKPPRNRGAYRAKLLSRMRYKSDAEDVATWKRWLAWQEQQQLAESLRN